MHACVHKVLTFVLSTVFPLVPDVDVVATSTTGSEQCHIIVLTIESSGMNDNRYNT